MQHISTAFSDNLAKLYTFWQNPIQFGKTIQFGKSPGFRQKVSVIPQSPYSQPYPKTQKRGAHQPLQWTPLRPKSLAESPYFQLFQAISLYFRQIVLKFLWHQLLIAACAATILWWLLPRGKNVYPLLPPPCGGFTPQDSTFDKLRFPLDFTLNPV